MVSSSRQHSMKDVLLGAEEPALLGKKLLPSAVIFGANASGKSNFVHAIAFLRSFVVDFEGRKPNRPTGVSSFAFAGKEPNLGTAFDITFVVGHQRFAYSLVLDATRVLRERLHWARKWAETLLFDREWIEDSHVYRWSYPGPIKADARLAERTRPEVSFLSVARQYNLPLLSEAYDWLDLGLAVIVARAEGSYLTHISAMALSEDDGFKAFLLAALRVADTGILDIVADAQPSHVQEVDYPSEVPAAVQDFFRQTMTESPERKLRFQHTVSDAATTAHLSFKDQSSGTQKLFSLGYPLYKTLQDGAVLVIDEPDTSLQPLIVRYLIGLFQNPETNPNGAQLICATHDTNILDLEVLRRDQVWFVQKDEQGASELYPLTDYSARNNESLEKGYLAGRYGAIPYAALKNYAFAG